MAVYAKTPPIPFHTDHQNPSFSKTPKQKIFNFPHKLKTRHQFSLRKPQDGLLAALNTKTTGNNNSIESIDTQNPNFLIPQLCLYGQLEQALKHLSESAQKLQINIEEESFVALIKLFEYKRAISEGNLVYEYVSKSNTQLGIRLGNALLSMFARFGNLVDAWYVFGKMEERDAFSWKVLVGGYAKSGFFDQALCLYHRMLWAGVRYGFESNVDVINALITMYVKCGDVLSARLVFDKMCRRDRISWNAMISGYFENEECVEGLQLFFTMRECSVDPDLMTLTSVISACESLSNEELAMEIHGYTVKTNFFSDSSVQNALLQIYSSVGNWEKAE